MSDSQRSHELQPTRLLHPWDFPTKSTGVGYHCLLRMAFLSPTKFGFSLSLPSAAAAKSLSVMSDSVRPHRRQPTRLHRPWDSPGKNTGLGCHFLLQCMKVKSESEAARWCPTLGFSRHEYWCGVPLPSLSLPSTGH